MTIKTTRKAFTLIELLVVISSIAVLAALLLPALKTAKDRSKNVICVNNERQMGAALNSFLADNDDWYPYVSPTAANGKASRLWHWQLGSYVGGTNSIKAAQLFYCPANPWPLPQKATLSANGLPWWNGTAPTLYGLNVCILPTDWNAGAPPYVSRMKPSDFPYIGQMMVTGETPYDWGVDANGIPNYYVWNDSWHMDGGGYVSPQPFFPGYYNEWIWPDISYGNPANGANSHPQTRINHNLAWNSLMGDGSARRVTWSELTNNIGTVWNSSGSVPLWNGGLYANASSATFLKNQKTISCPYPY